MHLRVCLIIGLCTFASAPAIAGPPESGTELVLDAGLATLVDVHVAVGRLRLTGGRDGEVRAEVKLAARDNLRDDARARIERALAGARITYVRRGEWLCLALTYPEDVHQGEVEEVWRVSAPARFGAEVEMAVGDLTVTNLSGGVDLQLGIGDIDIAVPHGDIKANVSVGNITAISSTDSWAVLALDARAGRSNLIVRGESHKAMQPVGPGSRVVLRGDGRDRVDLSANIGNVILKILDAR